MRLHYYYQVLHSILLYIHRPNKSKLPQGGDTERYNSLKEGNQEGMHTSKVRNTWSRAIQRIDRYRLTFYEIIVHFEALQDYSEVLKHSTIITSVLRVKKLVTIDLQVNISLLKHEAIH